jgi:transglutaminase-like putative cysteine protease
MNRRYFLQLAGLATAGLRVASAQEFLRLNSDMAGWRVYEVTTKVEVLKPSGKTRVWVPTPLTTNTKFQKTLSNKWHSEGGKINKSEDKAEGLGIIRAEFPTGVLPQLLLTSVVATRDWSVNLATPGTMQRTTSGDLARFLQPTKYVPTDGIVKKKATEITKDCRTDVDKARAIYTWIVENTYRNPKVRGCGVGDIRFMLETGDLGGKCADLNALSVGLSRAAGLPARDVYGVRTGKSNLGYKSLGASSENVTKSQHCRAEVYLSSYGWVPMDPADVRKVILEEPPGNLPIDDDKVKAARSRLFGAWEMNWMAYNYAQDVALPGSQKEPIRFFMYPQAETETGRPDSLDPENFRYEIQSREITSAAA